MLTFATYTIYTVYPSCCILLFGGTYVGMVALLLTLWGKTGKKKKA